MSKLKSATLIQSWVVAELTFRFSNNFCLSFGNNYEDCSSFNVCSFAASGSNHRDLKSNIRWIRVLLFNRKSLLVSYDEYSFLLQNSYWWLYKFVPSILCNSPCHHWWHVPWFLSPFSPELQFPVPPELCHFAGRAQASTWSPVSAGGREWQHYTLLPSLQFIISDTDE